MHIGEQNDKVFYSFMVMSHSGADHAKVIRYLDGFPLCSFNYLAYNDPALVVKQNRLRTGNALT